MTNIIKSLINAKAGRANPWRIFLRIVMWAVLGVTLLLSGCVSLSLSGSDPQEDFTKVPGLSRQAHLAKIDRWSTMGAFSIKQTGEEPVLANYHWIQESKSQYRIRIASALHLFSISIYGRLKSVTLWKSTTQHVTARTPEALLRKEMGWSLPIRNMFYWTRGVAAPGRKKEQFDKYGHLVSLTQQGWEIQFSNYSTVKGFDLPRKLVLSHPGLQVTVVIKKWRLFHINEPL